jgi:hypothetical protein
VALCIPLIASADDHKSKHNEHKKRHSEDSFDESVPVIKSDTYTEACGRCHFSYPPSLLNANSWVAIIDNSEDHFGESLALNSSESEEIKNYLRKNSAENSNGEIAHDISKDLGSRVVSRIIDVPEIRKEHRDISQDILSRPSIGGLSNCIACHRRAEEGFFDDDNVIIPN